MSLISADIKMLPVNLKVIEDDTANDSRDLLSEVLEKNSDFRRFTQRMKGMARVFAIKSKKDSTVRLVSPSRDDDEQNEELDREWLECCLREYLERKRLFGNRFKSRKQLVLRIVTLLVPFLAVLWSIWPLWRVLIDVETDAYYKALGVPSTATSSEITRAYRNMMKKWHPDHNPNCGQYCRDETERIKDAYNMLLSRGDHQFTLANQYHEGLMTLRSALSFRGFQISSRAAMGVFMALSRMFPTKAKNSSTLRLGCNMLILLFCTVHETLYVSGFNIATIISLFYYCISMAKTSAQQRSMEEVTGNSYFDVLRDATVLLGCAGVASMALFLTEHPTVSTEEIFRMLYGGVYVMSFLYKFAPNIYDNFLMRKYSLPLTYLDMGSVRFTWTNFALSELSFAVDDLFVFTCRIPGPYRVLVYIAHFVCLCQLFLLPWDAPITSVKKSAKTSAPRAKEAGPTALAASKSAMDSVAEQADNTENVINPTICESPLTKEEEGVVTDLDSEEVTWLDIASLKYKTLVMTLGRKYSRQRGQNADAVDIAASADLQHVCIFAFGRASGAGAGATQPKINVLCQVRDPDVSRLIAQDRGPRVLTPPRSNTPWNLDMARAEYRKMLGVSAPLTNSQIWRKRTAKKALQAWQAVLVMALVCCVTGVICVLLGPTAFDVVRSTKGVDSSLRPQLFSRFSGVLPAEHFTNALSGGLLTAANLTLCVLDWWDAGATLGFIR
ncbi:hypothetical protein ABB37_03161 [Leptomonas pyrrhocoris]|uniref:J domain-containing protein n=1 Tax=Leptomonas pyrrhocoris TaxID=157538 RepID=A0A0M9G4B6_LEPPY|nr:hypothetical protein ABB37_03161 [Leptomonas pyrrhocoris]KPA81977.1 hypothetical protein ABB37_03161 [Leptomonas pyrrhocoris]|eukprot:XP_015660416.1 hypothetical protein ABB37_03161 [Leptomonas pyrrhocoris]